MAGLTKPRKTPAQDRSRNTVEAIVEAGARILMEEGYSQMSTNRVAELAGVSIGSLYQYFQNKEAVLGAIYQRHQARVRDAITFEFDGSSNLADYATLRQLVEAVFASHAIEPRLHARFEALRQDAALPVALGEGSLEAVAAKLAGMLRVAFALKDQDADLSAWMLVNCVHGLVHADQRSGEDFAQHRVIDEIALLLYGYVMQLKQVK